MGRGALALGLCRVVGFCFARTRLGQYLNDIPLRLAVSRKIRVFILV